MRHVVGYRRAVIAASVLVGALLLGPSSGLVSEAMAGTTPAAAGAHPRKIAFACGGPTGFSDICVVNADGTQLKRLTRRHVEDAPGWSPDGSKLAFGSGRDGVLNPNDPSRVTQEIYVTNAQGRHARCLTKNQADDREPRWSPDGKHIAFVSSRDGQDEIYVMNADGTHIKRVSHKGHNNTVPFWSS